MSLLPNHPKRVAARERLAKRKAARQILHLYYPAPRRCWERGPSGWHSHPWTETDVLRAVQAGSTFVTHVPGTHDFASHAAAKLATDAQRSLDFLFREPTYG